VTSSPYHKTSISGYPFFLFLFLWCKSRVKISPPSCGVRFPSPPFRAPLVGYSPLRLAHLGPLSWKFCEKKKKQLSFSFFNVLEARSTFFLYRPLFPLLPVRTAVSPISSSSGRTSQTFLLGAAGSNRGRLFSALIFFLERFSHPHFFFFI